MNLQQPAIAAALCVERNVRPFITHAFPQQASFDAHISNAICCSSLLRCTLRCCLRLCFCCVLPLLNCTVLLQSNCPHQASSDCDELQCKAVLKRREQQCIRYKRGMWQALTVALLGRPSQLYLREATASITALKSASLYPAARACKLQCAGTGLGMGGRLQLCGASAARPAF